MRNIKLLIIIITNIILVGLIGCETIFASTKYNKAKAKDYFEDELTIMLVTAAEKGNIKKIDEALSKGADINAVSKDGKFTPLLWVYSKLNKKGYEYLLQKGANPNYHDKDGNSLMFYSAGYENPYYLETALKYNGNPNTLAPRPSKYKNTIIFTAIVNYRVENIKLLIESGADLNYQNNLYFTPMIYASIDNSYDIVYLLLEAGADPLIKTDTGFTLIDRIEEKNVNPKHPVFEWYVKVIELLRTKGIEVNVDLDNYPTK